MQVLVTGGTGVIGRATVTELLRRGHTVRLLSRGAAEDVEEWQDQRVQAYPGNVADANAIRGAGDGCGAVVHIVGIVEESPPEVTFESVNVGGTRNILAEAARAGVSRVVFISSLGAERGESDYHASKVQAEDLVQRFDGDWTILRTGAVVGPGDETVSVLLRMVRILPAVPVIDDGDQPFQPVWHEDLAWAIAECVERDDVARTTLRIAGDDVITVNEVLDLFSNITDRDPVRVPLPSLLAKLGTSLASALGIETPVSASTVQMLLEGNVIGDDEANDLTQRLAFRPEPIRTRLAQLADEMLEQTPDEGVGRLQRRRFRVDIAGSRFDARALFEELRRDFADIAPFEAAAEPGSPVSLEPDATLTLELPARGHVQVRVVDMTDQSVTLATLEGHPLAGVVRFRFDDVEADTPDNIRSDVVRFTIDVVERPASRVDQISMALVGSAAQKRTWQQTAENVVERSGGSSDEGVQEESWSLDDEAAEPLEDWVRDLINRDADRK
ncbi:MAG TPA: NAD-dependent epimerase/dehydratase family protein [Longimicrobiales bacterium]|nr:NAD-dependent epimerase/dehydratase family protein [Longimicrobiales bacterium]